MNWKLFSLVVLAAGLLGLIVGGYPAAAQHDHAASEQKAAATGDPYTLSTCPVSGETLPKDAVKHDHNGREIRFCCPDCVKAFEKEPQPFIEKIDAALIKDQLPFYSLQTCVVSGEKMGGMGEAVNKIYNNRLVRFCCEGCIAQFDKDPAAFLKKLDAAVIEKQKAEYALKTCPVSGEAVGGSMGDPVDVVLANRLVRLCCPSCKEALLANPAQYLSKIEPPQKSE